MSLRARGRASRSATLFAFLIICIHPAPSFTAQQADQAEISTQEAEPAFTIRARTNEVLVRVVVRDANGNAVSNLTKEDFRILDNGKPQVVGQFSIEKGGAVPIASEKAGQPKVEPQPEQAKPAAPPPGRFVAFYFDDTFMSFEDISRTRDAAARYLNSSLTPGDRMALYTSSGAESLDFTSDRDQFEAALAKLSPHPLAFEKLASREDISDYQAYLISVRGDKDALDLAIAQVKQILCGTADLPAGTPAGANVNSCAGDPAEYAKAKARQIWEKNRYQVDRSLQGLLALVRRLSVMPGQRIIVWVSPGFLGMDQNEQLTSLDDQALRARVVINALDSRGVWILVPGGEASRPGAMISGTVPRGGSSSTGTMQRSSAGQAGQPFPVGGGSVAPSVQANLQGTWNQIAQEISSAVLDDAAAATGGVFVHDTNDFDSGFRRVGGLPEIAYLLSFSPQNLKFDGKYHKLSVELVNGRGLSLQARKGYFAPAEAPNSERQAKQDLEDAVFASEERTDLHLGVQTQFFMTSQTEGQLSVLALVDLRGARLRKEQEISVDRLNFVTALFDENGNLLEGRSRIINLRLKEATLDRLLASGLRTGWRFKVKPGTYVVREVVQDGGSGGIAALSRTVEIPYSY